MVEGIDRTSWSYKAGRLVKRHPFAVAGCALALWAAYLMQGDDQPLPAAGIQASQAATTAENERLDVLVACQHAIKARLKFPSSFDDKWIGTSADESPKVPHAWIARVPFEAKNGIGNTIPQLGLCIVKSGTVTNVSITNR